MSLSDEDIEKMKAKIKHELEPLMNKILSLSDEDLLEFGEEYKHYLIQYIISSNIIKSFTLEYDVNVLSTSIKEQVFLLYTYLGMVESLGNWTANILIMLLIASGKDFHIKTPIMRHVYSLDDLEEKYVPLKMKLNFLREFGIKTYPSIFDNKLRNDIAHFKFKIENNEVTIKGKKVWELIYPNIRRIQGANAVIGELFDDLGKTLGW